MGMPKGLSKATNYYNNIEAWNDWRKIAKEVTEAGGIKLVIQYAPPINAGWRKVDKAIAALREAFQQQREADAKCLCPCDGISAFCPIHGAVATGRGLR